MESTKQAFIKKEPKAAVAKNTRQKPPLNTMRDYFFEVPKFMEMYHKLKKKNNGSSFRNNGNKCRSTQKKHDSK